MSMTFSDLYSKTRTMNDELDGGRSDMADQDEILNHLPGGSAAEVLDVGQASPAC